MQGRLNIDIVTEKTLALPEQQKYNYFLSGYVDYILFYMLGQLARWEHKLASLGTPKKV